MLNNNEYKSNFTFLNKPLKVSEQSWDLNTLPLVSISCITYNHEKFISEALDGFLMQETTFPIEILIHDDASTDQTQEIIRKYETEYPHLFKVIYQKENQYSKKVKIGSAFQYPRVKGKYYATCEGDDYWIDPLKLQKQVTLLEENPETGIVHTKYIIKNEIQGSSIVHERKIYNKNYNDFTNYLFTGDMRTLTVMFRSSYFQCINKLLEQPEMRNAPLGDRLIFLLITSKSKIGYINEVCGVYRIFNGESATRFNEKKGKYEFGIKVNKANLFLNEYLGINDNKYKKYLINEIRFNQTIVSYIDRNYGTFLKHLFLKIIYISWYRDLSKIYTKARKKLTKKTA